MSKNPFPVWQPVITKSPLDFNEGDLLAPGIPHNNKSIIFVIDGIDENGMLHLKTWPLDLTSYTSNRMNLHVNATDLIRQGWYFIR